jgi:hypothetical protein
MVIWMNENVTPPKKFNTNIIWIILVIILLAGNIIFVISWLGAKSTIDRYSNAADEIAALDRDLTDCWVRLDDAEEVKKVLERRIDALEKRINRMRDEVIGISSMSNEAARELRLKGLKNPEQEIIEDLMNHPELIQYQPVLGGKMGFYDRKKIFVLNEHFVYAHFSDGHSSGTMVLEYDVDDNAEISWQVLKAYKN